MSSKFGWLSSPTTVTPSISAEMCSYHGLPVHDLTAPTGLTPRASNASVPSLVNTTTRIGVPVMAVSPIAWVTLRTSSD
ncbi:hypothetical protein D3C75_766900 [compost metagenome]